MTTPGIHDDAQRETLSLPLGDRTVVLKIPTEGQLIVIGRLPSMVRAGKIPQAMMTFGDVLDVLFVEADDRTYAYDGLINETLETNEYLDLMLAILRHMNRGEAAPTNGPAPKKRVARARVR